MHRSSDQFRRVTLQCFIVRLIILAFLGNSVFMSVANAAFVNADGSQVLLCTSNGYQWLTVGDPASQDDPRPHCVFCTGLEDTAEPQSIADQLFLHSENHTLVSIYPTQRQAPRILPPSRAPPKFLRL